MVRAWSLDRGNHKPWAMDVNWQNDLPLQTTAYQWAMGFSATDMVEVGIDASGIQFWLIKSRAIEIAEGDITAAAWKFVKLYHRGIPTNWMDAEPRKLINLNYFDGYVKIKKSFHLMKYDSSNDTIRCNCSVYLKQYACCHSIGLLFRMRIIQLDARVASVTIGQKRKPGRPKNVGPALSFE